MFNHTLCIPRVCKTFTKTQIYHVFNQYNFGKIKKIQIIENKNKNSNIAHIYYNYWYDNEYVNNVKEKLTNNLNIKIFYDTPWFWIVYPHKEKHHEKENQCKIKYKKDTDKYTTSKAKTKTKTKTKWKYSKLKKIN